VRTIVREARKQKTVLSFVTKERLNELSRTGHHQGVIARVAAYAYAEVADMLSAAREAGEDPFLVLLDGIEDPYNFGAIIRTAHQAGAHGVITTKHRSAPLSATVVRASAGALNYCPVARVTNLGQTIAKLQEEGIWFVCADMDGKDMYDLPLTGPIGVIIGGEGDGVHPGIVKACDMTAAIPMVGKIDSLNASVAAGVLLYEIVRQRRMR